MTRPPCLSALFLTLLLTAVVWASAQDRPSLTPEAWLKAVETHEPGTADQAAIDVGRASTRDLRVVFEAVTELATHRAMSAVFERAAWLHADIAMLVPDAGGPPFDHRRHGLLLALDGRGLGVGPGSRHLEVGWALLAVKRAPVGRDAVRRWYQATAAYVLGRYLLGDAKVQLDDARRLFPDEAWVAFDQGCLNETWAAPSVQRVVRRWVAERRYAIADERTQLVRAERYFKQALEIDPDFVEARLRLGRVIGLDGRHDAAVRELERVIDAAPDRILQYYAHLFLGHEYDALDRSDAAREQYERAAALYPRAQSPYLALSHLVRVGGDAAAAIDAVHRILELPAGEEDRADPWWVYPMGRGRDADAIVDAARRRAFRGGGS